MKVIPTSSAVVQAGGQFTALTPGVEVELADDLAQQLIDGGHAKAADKPKLKPQPVSKRLPGAPENK